VSVGSRAIQLRQAAAKLPLKPREYAQSPRQNRECCQQVAMNHGDLVLFRCALPGQGVQRELPSTITYSQNFGGSAQKKVLMLFEDLLIFSSAWDFTGLGEFPLGKGLVAASCNRFMILCMATYTADKTGRI
jgi:hypothetical protein